MKIGENIKNRRKELGLSQREFAKKLNIPFSTLANYENNYREPNLETIERIATALEVPISAILSKDDMVGLKLEQLHNKIDQFVSGDYSSPFLDTFEEFQDIINLYDQLNALGREKALEYIKDLLESGKYKE